MLCGTPVVAYNKGSMPELIKHGKSGFLVDTKEEAAEALGDLNQISRLDCRKWAESQFSQEKMVQEYLTVYQMIIDSLNP